MIPKRNIDGRVNKKRGGSGGYDPYSDNRNRPPCQCFCDGGIVETTQTLCIWSCSDCDPHGRSCAEYCNYAGCMCGNCGYYSGEWHCGWDHRMCGPHGYDPTNPLCFNNFHHYTVM